VTKLQADRLRQGREQAGYTQKEAATALTVAYSTYRGWESGLSEPGSLQTVVRISALFRISLDWWLLDKPSKTSEQELTSLANQLEPETREALLTVLRKLTS